MNNNLITKIGADPQPFFKELIKHLSNNIESDLCQSVANLLSLDYATRLSSEPPLQKYIHTCITRLQNHLKERVILDNNFSESMDLFTVAITPEQELVKNNSKSQDALISNVVNAVFNDLSEEESSTIKIVIKNLLNGKNSKKIINMITSEPNIVKKIITNSIKNKIPNEEITNIVNKNIMTLANELNDINEGINNTSNLIGKSLFTTGLLLTSSVGLFISGLTLPAVIIPATISIMKIVPIIEKKILNKMIKNNTIIQNKTKKFDNLKILSTNIKGQIEKYKTNTLQNLSSNQAKHFASDVDMSKLKAKEIQKQKNELKHLIKKTNKHQI